MGKATTGITILNIIKKAKKYQVEIIFKENKYEYSHYYSKRTILYS